MFDPPSKYVREGIKAEAARPGVFLNRVVVLEYSQLEQLSCSSPSLASRHNRQPPLNLQVYFSEQR
jgi:hypothetical protein